MENQKLFGLVAVWILTVAIVIVAQRRRKTPGAGLVLAYLLNLSLNHLIGGAIYLLPGFQSQDARLTELGFAESTYGAAAFAAGALVIAPWLLRRKPSAQSGFASGEVNPLLPKALMGCGAFLYVLSMTSLGTLPSASAIISTGPQLVVAGLVLLCWRAWRERKPMRVAGWMAVSLLLPITTVLTSGFLGYGIVAILTVMTFAIGLVSSPWKVLAGGTALTYLGLSLFVSYMRDRSEIRKSVWGEESYENRLSRVSETMSTFEWFDVNNHKHLERVDDRLNQNYLVGAAVNRLTDNHEFANGDTLWQAMLALVPRAIWADKPIEAGSGTLVTQFTGIEFSEGTSVGIGQVMEFYANFGTSGVIVGFLVFGVVITMLDVRAAEHLNSGDAQGFVLRYLPGLSLLQVGGQLVEITASALGSLIVAFLVTKSLQRLQSRRLDVPAVPVPSAY